MPSHTRRNLTMLAVGVFVVAAVLVFRFLHILQPFGSPGPSIDGPSTATNTSNGTGTTGTNTPTAQWKQGPTPTVPDINALSQVTITPALVEPPVKSLSEVKNYIAAQHRYNLKLSAAEEAYLLKNRFLLVPLERTTLVNESGFDEMLAAFDRVKGADSEFERLSENTKLVTPDVVLHAYHRFFENSLEELEKNELNTSLNSFLEDLSANLEKNKTAQPALAQRYEVLLAQIAVPRALLNARGPAKPNYFETADAEAAFGVADKTADSLDSAQKLLAGYTKNLPATVQAAAALELKNIYAQKPGKSPLYAEYKQDVTTDYTQYTPRSHYNKSSVLRAYFRAMMYLGRNSYFLAGDNGFVDSNLLWQAIGQTAASGRAPLSSWQRIMGITGFYAGASDDLTYTEWTDFITKVLGSATVGLNELGSNTTVQKQVANIDRLRLPKILSDLITNENILGKTKTDLLRDTLSFRLFGQRFTYDAWILNDLTKGDEKSNFALPSMPTALFVPAALKSPAAIEYVAAVLQKERGFTSENVTSFMGALTKKQQELAAVKSPEWFSSLSSAWLFVLSSLTQNFGAGYPAYMQSAAFATKQVQTFLGSYTELKHDTVLYAKQSYSERGGGPGDDTPKPIVRGFVEPNMLFWQKLSALVTYNQQLFTYYDVFSDHPARERLREFGDTVSFYKTIAEKELKNELINDLEYEKLRITGLGFMADPFDGGDPAPDAWQTALVTDVHTDGISNKILYEGTLRPLVMLAIVSNESNPRLVLGPVFRHVEFTHDIGPRLTDEEWRSGVYDGADGMPQPNFWYEILQP